LTPLTPYGLVGTIGRIVATRKELVEENQIHLDGLALRAKARIEAPKNPPFWKGPVGQGAVQRKEIGLILTQPSQLGRVSH